MGTAMGERLRLSREAANIESFRDAEEALERARKRIGLSLPENQPTQVSYSAIRHHELGTNVPGPHTLLCYAVAYGRSMYWLLTGEGEKEWSPALEEGEPDERLRHYMTVVGAWLLRRADSTMPVLTEGEMPPKDERQGKGRSVGTPRRDTGS